MYDQAEVINIQSCSCALTEH